MNDRFNPVIEPIIRSIKQYQKEFSLPSVSEISRIFNDPFAVLISTMISLRTKDKVTEQSALRLLKEAPVPAAMASLPADKIAGLIYPAGFYKTKARNIKTVAAVLTEQYKGKVPSEMEALLSLPGVGRKTANLVRTLSFNLPGICVDTHVHRISNRIGWVSTHNPEQTEQALMSRLPQKYWIQLNHILVKWGQTICTPISPWCTSCCITRYCFRRNVKKNR